MTDNILSFISIARKAGKVNTGEFLTEKDIKSGHSHLVIFAEDISENAFDKISSMCKAKNVPFRVYGNKESLGRATGKNFAACLSFQNKGFAESLLKKLS